MAAQLALLRGINVAAQRKVPMAELRALAEGLGLRRLRTFIASGNLLFESEEEPGAVEAMLEQALLRRFGFPVDAMIRTAEQWSGYCEANPFPAESRASPGRLLLFVGKEPATDAHVEALSAKAGADEKVARTGDAIWIFYPEGAGRSKIGSGPRPGLWTGRNWRTVETLETMLCGRSR